MWPVLGVLGVLVVVTGALPNQVAWDVAITRGAPIMAFLVAVTVLAELAGRAGVFDAAAGVCARAARGSVVRLYLLVAALATVTTIGMSLDTTAVLLTPVVLALAARLGLSPVPFALVVVWLANTASLLLPVSNLTNLLAAQQLDDTTIAFATRMAAPEAVAVALSVAYVFLTHRGDLRGRYDAPVTEPAADTVLFWICAGACIALAPAVLLGVPPWAAALPCATVCAAAFAVRRRGELTWSVLPWRLVVLTEGLFLVVTALARHGGTALLERLIGHSTLAATGIAAATSNLVNNLPAYLALESAAPASGTTGLLAVLIGTNAGPLVAVWGSLATLLWRERCRAGGLHISPVRFALLGLGGAPVVLAGAWAALLLTGP